jgi:hypothetical protein
MKLVSKGELELLLTLKKTIYTALLLVLAYSCANNKAKDDAAASVPLPAYRSTFVFDAEPPDGLTYVGLAAGTSGDPAPSPPVMNSDDEAAYRLAGLYVPQEDIDELSNNLSTFSKNEYTWGNDFFYNRSGMSIDFKESGADHWLMYTGGGNTSFSVLDDSDTSMKISAVLGHQEPVRVSFDESTVDFGGAPFVRMSGPGSYLGGLKSYAEEWKKEMADIAPRWESRQAAEADMRAVLNDFFFALGSGSSTALLKFVSSADGVSFGGHKRPPQGSDVIHDPEMVVDDLQNEALWLGRHLAGQRAVYINSFYFTLPKRFDGGSGQRIVVELYGGESDLLILGFTKVGSRLFLTSFDNDVNEE